jgi:thiosulfate/3-mercaptopyruvate sulfurtransferase
MLKSANGILGLFLSLILISYADAACSISGGCGNDYGDWESSANAFLNSDIPGSFIQSNSLNAALGADVSNGKDIRSAASKSNNSSTNENMALLATVSKKFVNGDMLESLLGVSSSDLVVEVSNGDQYLKQPHIKGAIHLPSYRFLYENGTLRPISELAKVLGDAGISREDSVVICSDDRGLNDATFVHWVMFYLGQDDARVLDGNLNDWMAAGLPLESQINTRTPTIYEPKIRTELLADQDYLSSGKAQLVDARSFQDYAQKPLKGLVRIDPAQVLNNGRIKDPMQLNDTFSRLDADRAIVVYSEDGLNASIVWFALQLSGYNSLLYSWKDKLAQLPSQAAKENVTKIGTFGRAPIDSSKYRKLGG